MIIEIGGAPAAPAADRPRVVIDGRTLIGHDSGEQDDSGDNDTKVLRSLEVVLNEVAEEYGCSIRCEVPHMKPRPPLVVDRGVADLIICIAGSPTAAKWSEKTRTAYGIPLPHSVQDTVEPSGQGQLVTDPSGRPVAEVIPWTQEQPGYVYILFDLVHQSFRGLRDLMRKILADTVPRACPDGIRDTAEQAVDASGPGIRIDVIADLPSPPPRQTLPDAPFDLAEETRRQGQWLAEAASFRNASCVHHVEAFEAGMYGHALTLPSMKAGVDRTAEELRATATRFEDLDRRCSDRARVSELAAVAISREYDAILRLGKVEGVTISDDAFVVKTGHLEIRERSKVFDIGGWEIHIPRKGTNVRIHPRSRKNGHHGWPHPHVSPSGEICWGNVKSELTEAMRRSEYDVAVQFLIALLETGIGRRSDAEFHWSVLQSIGTVVGEC